MQNKLLFILFLFSYTQISLANCFKTKTSHIESQKKIEITEDVCEYSYKNLIFYVSKKCFEKHNECLSLLREESVSVKNAFSEIGSPGFKLCFALKGSPQIFEFEKNKINEESDRCLLSNNLWIEIPLLMKLKTIK